jgi:hypothetical protein
MRTITLEIPTGSHKVDDSTGSAAEAAGFMRITCACTSGEKKSSPVSTPPAETNGLWFNVSPASQHVEHPVEYVTAELKGTGIFPPGVQLGMAASTFGLTSQAPVSDNEKMSIEALAVCSTLMVAGSPLTHGPAVRMAPASSVRTDVKRSLIGVSSSMFEIFE